MAEYLQRLPLYQQQSHSKHINPFTPGINKGLLFDRWFGGYDANWKVDKLTDNGAHPLSWLAGECGDKVMLERAQQRQLELVGQLAGAAITATLDWHMVTGTGEAHPLENGFRWHHGLAVPYLPASSLKGMLRAWLTCWDTEKFTQQEIALLLGNEQKSDVASVGNLILFDALPTECPTLTLDVMTPHCGDWYQNGATNPGQPDRVPADWQSPVPITFLAVKKATFLFSMASRNEQVQALLPQVQEALSDALCTLGIGAKTAAGYGVMSKIAKAEPTSGERLLAKAREKREESLRQLRKQQSMAAMTPNQLQVSQLTERLQAQNSADITLANKHKESLNSEVAAMVNQALTTPWSSEERQALILMVKEHSRWLQIANKDKSRERKALIAQLEA